MQATVRKITKIVVNKFNQLMKEEENEHCREEKHIKFMIHINAGFSGKQFSHFHIP